MRIALVAGWSVVAFLASPQAGLEGQAGRGPSLTGFVGEPNYLFLHPSLTILRGGGERRLNGELGWEVVGAMWEYRLGLVFGTSSRSGSYAWSGAQGDLGWRGERIRLKSGMQAHGASGDGPASAVSFEFELEARNTRLRVTPTWLGTLDATDSGVFGGVAQGDSGDQRVHADLTVASDLGHSRVELRGGLRLGDPTPGPARWIQAEVQIPIGRGFGLSTAGGVRPDRPERGQLGGRYLELGATLRLGGAAAEPVPPPRPPALWAEALGPDCYRLIVETGGASSVELRGDITDWQIVELGRSGGEASRRWTVRLDRRPGVYQVAVRLDGDEWQVPRGLIPVPDRFGGAAGLLELPTMEEDQNAK